jgi:hypothetical protein
MPENKDADNDVEKGLKKFDKELDMYLAIKQKIETAFSVHNETARNEDRALQIRLAQLNTDLQVFLAGVFGFFAGGIALAVFGIQLFIDQLPTYPAITITTLYFLVVSIVSLISFYGVFKLIRRLNICYKEIKNLR